MISELYLIIKYVIRAGTLQYLLLCLITEGYAYVSGYLDERMVGGNEFGFAGSLCKRD